MVIFYYYKKIIIKKFVEKEKMKTREDKRMVKLDFFKTAPFDILKKISTFIFWCMVIPLDPQLVYT